MCACFKLTSVFAFENGWTTSNQIQIIRMDCEKTIYSIHPSPKDIGLPYGGIYYQTHGGGPEGGYLQSRGKIYSVSRSWGEPWAVTKVNGVLHFRKNESGDEKGYVRFVPNF